LEQLILFVVRMFSKHSLLRLPVLMAFVLMAGVAYAVPDDNTTVSVEDVSWEGEIIVTIPMKPFFVLGDANDDGNLTDTDVVSIVNYILGNPSADFNFKAADVNGDEKITIADVVGVVNIILNQEQ